MGGSELRGTTNDNYVFDDSKRFAEGAFTVVGPRLPAASSYATAPMYPTKTGDIASPIHFAISFASAMVACLKKTSAKVRTTGIPKVTIAKTTALNLRVSMSGGC